jgi:hypothetical protein
LPCKTPDPNSENVWWFDSKELPMAVLASNQRVGCQPRKADLVVSANQLQKKLTGQAILGNLLPKSQRPRTYLPRGLAGPPIIACAPPDSQSTVLAVLNHGGRMHRISAPNQVKTSSPIDHRAPLLQAHDAGLTDLTHEENVMRGHPCTPHLEKDRGHPPLCSDDHGKQETKTL